MDGEASGGDATEATGELMKEDGELWVRACDFRLCEVVNDLVQVVCWQEYGRSPVCVRLCVFRWCDAVNALPQPPCLHL